ncbi:MFS transporter [Amycolatopsis rubida]|uniref:MFS transporter n=1 Tax=Amycolatopsis rubida TaxID=112413 RepID=A0A1I5F7K5_9PSEU|nr:MULTISPECIES: MFS transporter [Amycolatopsis]MYW92209.1 MFS transporter [Amycolatopsis rubida]NEC57196.1 MFS transporter [Amycolatopsis rubida]OAP27062.1 Multidrug resistance protein MdtL [Amycolatopsis sp. M39]SFO19737.1 Predicted arabinose efflux permease, MFS family [Amycolatopsis rubida]
MAVVAPSRAGSPWLAAWPVTAVFVLSNAPTPLYVLWQHRLGFSAGTLTVIFAAYIAGLLAALLVAGRASDRLGRKPVVLPGVLLALIACGLFAVATSVLALVAARLLAGIAVGITVSAGMAAVVDVGGPGRARTATLAASTAMVFGAGLGPLLAGALSENLPGPTVTIFALSAVLLLSAVVVVVRLPLQRPVDPDAAGWVRIPAVPRAQRKYVALGIAVFAPGITSTSFVLSLGPALLANVLGTSNRLLAGVTAFVMFGAATAVQFAAKRLEVRAILLTGAAVGVACMAALLVAVHAQWIVAIVVTAVLAGAAQGLGQLGGLTLISTHVSGRRRAEANALLNFGGYLPAALLSVGTGYLSDALGIAAGSTVFAALLALASLTAGGIVWQSLRNGRRAPSRAPRSRRSAPR